MSLEFILGNSTNFDEDLKFYYFNPKKEWSIDYKIYADKMNTELSIKDIREAWERKTNSELSKNDTEYVNNSLWDEKGNLFFGKDGATNTHQKRGIDDEFFEFFERQITEKKAWRVETSNSYLDFKVGGKIKLGDEEYVIMKVINAINSLNIPNTLKARPNMNFVKSWGVKTLILA